MNLSRVSTIYCEIVENGEKHTWRGTIAPMNKDQYINKIIGSIQYDNDSQETHRYLLTHYSEDDKTKGIFKFVIFSTDMCPIEYKVEHKSTNNGEYVLYGSWRSIDDQNGIAKIVITPLKEYKGDCQSYRDRISAATQGICNFNCETINDMNKENKSTVTGTDDFPLYSPEIIEKILKKTKKPRTKKR